MVDHSLTELMNGSSEQPRLLSSLAEGHLLILGLILCMLRLL